MSEKEKEPEAVDVEEKTTEAKIHDFAAKLGEEVGNKYQVYIYRIVRDEETGKTKKPFIKKYIGVEPDPAEIAERFRGGSYLVQFIWYVKKEQKSKAYTVDVDADAFPPLPKQNTALSPYAGNPNLSESMQIQLVTIQSIAEVMKAAYAQGGGNGGGGRAVVQQDPLEVFSGLMETMEESYSRAMQIQNRVMERVYLKAMENKMGLLPDATGGGAAVSDAEAESGFIGKYAPLVREIVDGIKTVIGFFGEVPPNVVQKVKADGRFKELLKDPKALTVIGSALRREFGDEKAMSLMRTFGVQMVIRRSAGPVTQTPDIPSLATPAGGQESPEGGGGGGPTRSPAPARGPEGLETRFNGKKAGKVKTAA